MEKVSVIIPLYNAKPYIAQTVESILNQSFQDFIIYIIDDHSSDGSAEIAKRYAKENPKKIIYLRPTKTAGRPSTGKNIGIKMSQGEYVAFMDHDDWWESQHLEQLVLALDLNKSIGLVGANASIFDNDKQSDIAVYSSKKKADYSPLVQREAMIRPPFLTSSCMLFRREVFDALGLMDERLKMSDDHEIAMRMVLDKRFLIMTLPTVSIHRRWHRDSLSNNLSSIESALYDTEIVYEKCLSCPTITKEQKDSLNRWHQTALRRWANSLLANGDVEEAKKIYNRLPYQGKYSLLIQILRLLMIISPKTAIQITSKKKQWSFDHPEVF